MAKESTWQTLPLGLNGPMDSRSRPADLGPGIFRWKLNLAINSSGKLCRRAGFAALNFGLRSDTPAAVANWDRHRQVATREPPTLLSEITSPDNLRYLFAGGSQRVSWLDNGTSEWHDIITDGTAGSRWSIASLRDKVVLVNNVDPPRIHIIGATTPATILNLAGAEGTNGKIVVQYQNVIIMMRNNLVQWSDFREAEDWDLAPLDTIAGFKYLDDGEVILNCAELGGIIYIFTDRAIWKMFPNSPAADDAFGFHHWYGDPKTRTACLAYDNALVSTGKEIFYFGRNTIYWLNAFSSTPTSPDWLLKASGLVFEGDTRIDSEFCESPVGGFVPDERGQSREVWFSYPRLGSEGGINDYSIVLSFNSDSVISPWNTADYVDVGFTAFCNFSRTTDAGVTCNTTPTFIGASGEDYSLKSIGGVFHREMVTLISGNVATDIPDLAYATTQQGYFSQMLLLCPFGYEQRDKILRNVILSHDTADAISDTPNMVNLRIGNSHHLADPLATGPRCAVQWHQIDAHPLQCPDVDTMAEMEADGTRPDDSTEWPNQSEQGFHLYIDLKVQSFTGAAPVGGDSAFNTLTFDYLILP